MRIAAAVLAALLPLPSLAECTPPAPAAVAAAEKKASDAERKAEQAESIAVRSGNPGAQARAKQARAAAASAREDVARLECKAAGAAPAVPTNPATGY